MMMRWWFLCAAVLAANGASALDLPGNAQLTREISRKSDSYAIPIAPFEGESVPVTVLEGSVKRQAWRIPGAGLTPLQILAPVREQLAEDGFMLVFDCVDTLCGGFDFRFGIDVLPAPDMNVNLRSFHFATFIKGPPNAPDAAVTVLTSAARDAAYVQIIEASKTGDFTTDIRADATPVVAEQPVDKPSVPSDGAPSDLVARGSIILDGLEFETGATRLGAGPFDVLVDLASFLKDNPNLRIALVGHTDSVGSLDGNIRISRQRAQAVRQRLIDAHGVPAAQLDAEGMGYLAPRASNLTEDGRDANRRVEAIMLSTE